VSILLISLPHLFSLFTHILSLAQPFSLSLSICLHTYTKEQKHLARETIGKLSQEIKPLPESSP
jgi:hypothetical protein